MTQEQWFERLKGWVPSWVFESEQSNVAIFQAIAKILAQVDEDRVELFNQTMISEATDPYLSLHGDERQVERRSGESDVLFRARIQNTSTKPLLDPISILSAASSICTGTVTLQEDFDSAVFCDRENFCNRRDILVDRTKDVFTLVVDTQTDEIFLTLVSQINRIKSFGACYRVVERY